MKLSDIWNDIKAFFIKEKPLLDDAFAKANSFVNIVKSIAGSTAGQAIIAVAEALLPVGAGVKITEALANFFTDFKWVTAEEGKTSEQLVADGFAYINTLAGDGRAIALSNTASIVGKLISDETGAGVNIQQAIVSAPVVYNPIIMNPDNVAGADVKKNA